MKKFKQICVIVFLALLLLIVGTCIVLYWVNPELLKNTFEYCKTIMDQPLPIIGVSVGVFCFTLFEIFAHTSFGKNVYNKAKQENEKALAQYEELKEEAENYRDEAKELKDETGALVNELCNKYEDLSNELIKVCETSPNAKIQALAIEFKENNQHTINKINENIEKTFGNVELVEDKNFKYLEEKIAYLEKVVAQYGKESE